MTTERIASLDFLRGVAAWAVAIPHFFAFKSFYADTFENVSVLGVEIFFVLSGYVLAPQILNCLSLPLSELGVFLVRRWMRTIPAYAVALIVISVLFNANGSADFFRYLTYTQNLVGQSNSSDYYSVAWSLSVEEWFYIVFPIAMMAAFRVFKLNNVRAVIGAVAIFIAIVTVARFGFGPLDDWGPSVRRVVAFRIDSIAYGFLLYVVLNHVARNVIARISALEAVALLVVSAGLSMWIIELIARGGSIWPKHLFPFMAAAFGSVCIVTALCASRWLDHHPRMTRIGLFAGKISYSVYLFHLIFLTALSPVIDAWPLGVQLAIYLAVITAFTAMFYKTFERPILMARPDFKSGVLKPAF